MVKRSPPVCPPVSLMSNPTFPPHASMCQLCLTDLVTKSKCSKVCYMVQWAFIRKENPHWLTGWSSPDGRQTQQYWESRARETYADISVSSPVSDRNHPKTMCFNWQKTKKERKLKKEKERVEDRVGLPNPLFFALFNSQTIELAFLKHIIYLFFFLTYKCCVTTAAS